MSFPCVAKVVVHKVHTVLKLPVDQTASCLYQASSQTTAYDPDRLLVSLGYQVGRVKQHG